MQNLYSTLSCCMDQRPGPSSPFYKISRGIFQGDTLSPILFLTVFHPVIAMMSLDTQVGGVHCYICSLLEDNFDEKAGWYLAKIISVNDEDEVAMCHRCSGNCGSIHLSTIKWVPAKGNGKWYLPPCRIHLFYTSSCCCSEV